MHKYLLLFLVLPIFLWADIPNKKLSVLDNSGNPLLTVEASGPFKSLIKNYDDQYSEVVAWMILDASTNPAPQIVKKRGDHFNLDGKVAGTILAPSIVFKYAKTFNGEDYYYVEGKAKTSDLMAKDKSQSILNDLGNIFREFAVKRNGLGFDPCGILNLKNPKMKEVLEYFKPLNHKTYGEMAKSNSRAVIYVKKLNWPNKEKYKDDPLEYMIAFDKHTGNLVGFIPFFNNGSELIIPSGGSKDGCPKVYDDTKSVYFHLCAFLQSCNTWAGGLKQEDRADDGVSIALYEMVDAAFASKGDYYRSTSLTNDYFNAKYDALPYFQLVKEHIGIAEFSRLVNHYAYDYESIVNAYR